jgi:DNA polymerase-1
MSYIFRAYHAIPPFYSPSGMMTNAVYGYLRTLLKLIREKKPKYLVAIYDSGPVTFRTSLYDGYKANRGEPPPELIPQFEYAFKAAKAIGIPSYREDNYEADDIIATIAKYLRDKKKNVIIVTGDKDLLQLVGSSVSVWNISKDFIFRKKDVIEKFGIPPQQMNDFVGLVGDAIDNIPGVQGIGPKTASILLKKFLNLENIYKNIDQIGQLHLPGKERIKELLIQHQEIAILSKKIAALHDQIPLKLKLSDFLYQPPKTKKFGKLFDELGFVKIKDEIPLRR